jgi:dipeptidyl aminopeptidase/acylaminoacyl peptidase
MTVRDAIQSTRVLYGICSDPALLSPDGKSYLVVLLHGDVARNGSWIELLSGSTASLDSAAKGQVIARLFTKSTAEATNLIKNVQWVGDNEHVAFLWDSGQGVPQVVELDLRTHVPRTLTHHGAPIVEYDISRDGRTIIFTAQVPRDRTASSRMERTGFAVTDQSIFSLLNGDLDGWTPERHYETFVSSTTDGTPRKVREPMRTWSTRPELLKLSPDGQMAIAVRPVADVPADWDLYTDHIFRDYYLPAARQHPGEPSWIRQYETIDVRRVTGHPLWDAPQNAYGGVEWSPDSRRVLVGPTFLPTAQANAVGLSGLAVAEVNAESGSFTQVPTPDDGTGDGYRPLTWVSRDVIELADATPTNDNSVKLRFKKVGQEWQPIPSIDEKKPAHVAIELRQSPNDPPALSAIETKTRRERLIRELAPEFGTELELGRVERVHWKATDGNPWTGMLYYPVHYEAGRRFPLVIQTHGYSAEKFSLEGAFTTVFAAQPLANRDIAVLQVGGPDREGNDILATPQEPIVFTAGIEGAINEFIASGLADSEKIGIVGFSRTGWLVEYMLTHSHVPLAAAEVADNMDASYLQYLLSDSAGRGSAEAENGASPFGEGLETWIHAAPGFNAQKIHTPLRMEIDTGAISSVLGAWEMFSNLRYLHRPVELFVIPDIEHGVHVLQNPAQRLASEGGTVDWFCFWLKNEKDPAPAKAGQYERWRKLGERSHN